ncbi:hypothetical protein H0H93_002347 [Arthromyces matolae]|nr:hypothetical protein H0H93_002347 [Arthromyces matolae]
MLPPSSSTRDVEERPLLAQYTEDTAETVQIETDLGFEGGLATKDQLERSLLRKVDRRMSILILIYILNYIDRNNASAARLRGFEEDLHLKGNQFASILSILYFLLSKWYKRNELSRRTALLFAGNLISNAFGSLIASAILDTMDGVFGYTAWRWLTPAERALAIQRMTEDPKLETGSGRGNAMISEGDVDDVKPTSNEPEQGLRLALTDWKVWWLAISIAVMTVSLSFNAFFPTIGATLGYNTTTTLLLCAPPWFMDKQLIVVLDIGFSWPKVTQDMCVSWRGLVERFLDLPRNELSLLR